MQHEEREEIIVSLVKSLSSDLLLKTKRKIYKNPYIVYNEQAILDLMADYGVQRRTAKGWLLSAQIRLTTNRNKNAK